MKAGGAGMSVYPPSAHCFILCAFLEDIGILQAILSDHMQPRISCAQLGVILEAYSARMFLRLVSRPLRRDNPSRRPGTNLPAPLHRAGPESSPHGSKCARSSIRLPVKTHLSISREHRKFQCSPYRSRSARSRALLMGFSK